MPFGEILLLGKWPPCYCFTMVTALWVISWRYQTGNHATYVCTYTFGGDENARERKREYVIRKRGRGRNDVKEEEERSSPPIGPYQDPNLWHARNTARSIRTAQARVSALTQLYQYTCISICRIWRATYTCTRTHTEIHMFCVHVLVRTYHSRLPSVTALSLCFNRIKY